MVAWFALKPHCFDSRFLVGKYFVARLSTTKTSKILPPEKYPLYGTQSEFTVPPDLLANNTTDNGFCQSSMVV